MALPNFQYFPYEHLPFQLSEEVKVLPGPLKEQLSAESVKHWVTWLGSLDWDSFEKRKIYLQIISNSDAPNINDHENSRLSTILHDAYLALMICAPLRAQYDATITITGFGSLSSDEKISATQIQEISRYNHWGESNFMYASGYHNARNAFLRNRYLLQEWKTIFERLRMLRQKKRGNIALLLAVESLKNGLESGYLDFRIPFFVRASEAIMALKKGEGKATFAKRAKELFSKGPLPLFVSKKTVLEVLFSEIFELRNGSVHGMPFGWKIKNRTKSKRRVNQYEYLAEDCARRAIRLALNNPNLVKASANRTKLEQWCSKNW